MKLWVVALLLVTVQRADAQPVVPPEEATLAHQIAGCYQLEDGPWRADSVRAGDVSTKGTPLFFELTERRLEGWDALQSSARPMFAAHDSGGVFTYWQHIGKGQDTMIRVSYPMPMAGVELALAPGDQGLAGTVTAFTDAVAMGKPSSVRRRVRARRVTCVRVPGESTVAPPK